tara:strand:+ start:2672 stop:3232 length:561 start_codon:yes stop_codon:yes gene_type:complete
MSLLLIVMLVSLSFVLLVEEFQLLKLGLPDTTKVLMLLCVLVLFYKTRTSEGFYTKNLLKLYNGTNDSRKCGYDNIDLSNKSLELDKLCNYETPDPKDFPLKDNLKYQLPNSYRAGEFKADGMNKPSLDGSDQTKDISNFVFNQNVSSPDCCPSIYSSSTGCVCANKKQNEFIQSRGGNSSYPSLF